MRYPRNPKWEKMKKKIRHIAATTSCFVSDSPAAKQGLKKIERKYDYELRKQRERWENEMKEVLRMNEWREFQISVEELKEKFGIPKKCKLQSTSLIDERNIIVLKMWVDKK